jgi:hypothetical protein
VILALQSYVFDSYGTYCASALQGLVFVRGLVTTFPLFGGRMYECLGYEWATSLLGFVSLVLLPIPVAYFYKGSVLRWRSPWARENFESTEDCA